MRGDVPAAASVMQSSCFCLGGSAVHAKALPERPNSGTSRGQTPISRTRSVWSGLSCTARHHFCAQSWLVVIKDELAERAARGVAET